VSFTSYIDTMTNAAPFAAQVVLSTSNRPQASLPVPHRTAYRTLAATSAGVLHLTRFIGYTLAAGSATLATLATLLEPYVPGITYDRTLVAVTTAVTPDIGRIIAWLTLAVASPVPTTLLRRLPQTVMATSAALASRHSFIPRTLVERFSATTSLAQTLVKNISERLRIREVPQVQGLNPYAVPGLDLTATLQPQDVVVPITTNSDSSVTVSVTPAVVNLFSTDTGPTLRFQCVEDVTGLPVDLTGATVDLLIRRVGQLKNVFQAPLSACVVLPNPTTFVTGVTGNATTPQNVTVADATGITTTPPNNVVQAGIGTGNVELVTVTAVAGNQLTGLFTRSHAAGDAIALLSVAQYNAKNGYCTYAWPTGGLTTATTYQAQLRIQRADGTIQHSAQFTINCGASL
jgi:hypothetical protein